MKKTFHFSVALLSLLALVATAQAAAADEATEYRLKAALLHKFALFTEWPADVGPTLTVCVLGHDPFGPDLDELQGKAVNGRSLAVLRKPAAEGLLACQVVYVSPSLAGQMPRLLVDIQSAPVLTIADTPGAARNGVIINMAVAQGKVAFEANLLAARRAGITLRSNLLRLATEVYQ